MARPSKFTPERVAKLTTALALGATHRLACAYAGISEDSFERWQKSKAGFADLLREAEARGAIGWLQKIEAAGQAGDWRAPAWMLAHRYPEDYGRKVQDVREPPAAGFLEALRELGRSASRKPSASNAELITPKPAATTSGEPSQGRQQQAGRHGLEAARCQNRR